MITAGYKASPVHQLLGEEFFDPVRPADFPKTLIRFKNLRWAETLGLHELQDKEWIKYFARFEPLPDNLKEPLALRYHGHQFQHYNSDLGDGRGFLYAQLEEPSSKRILDLATKGSGTTPYSRRGDGRLTLKGAMREVLATEWLEALGVNTSKTFSVIETGEALERGDEPSPTRSAVLVRLSHSHIRFGSFQRLAFFKNPEGIKKLLRHSVKYYYPEMDLGLSDRELAFKFLEQVSLKTAELCAQWMIAGFVHGVLNTDNMVITGESFDYGPYRFLPHYDPQFTAAYFDQSGLYAYGRQPEAVYWNLQQFAFALTFMDQEPEKRLDEYLEMIQNRFPKKLNQSMTAGFLKRLNLKQIDQVQDEDLLRTSFEFLQTSQVSFDAFFFDWNGGLESNNFALASNRKDLYKGSIFEDFFHKLSKYEIANAAKLADLRKTWSKPESLIIHEIENIWESIDKDDDWGPFETKIKSFRAWSEWFNQQ